MREARAKRDGSRERFLIYCNHPTCPHILGRMDHAGLIFEPGYVEQAPDKWRLSKRVEREGLRSRRSLIFDNGQRMDMLPPPPTIPLTRLPVTVQCPCGRVSFVRATTAPVADYQAAFSRAARTLRRR